MKRVFDPEEYSADQSMQSATAGSKHVLNVAKTVLLVAALLLAFTQQDLFNSVVKFTLICTSSLPKILDTFELFKSSSQSA